MPEKTTGVLFNFCHAAIDWDKADVREKLKNPDPTKTDEERDAVWNKCKSSFETKHTENDKYAPYAWYFDAGDGTAEGAICRPYD